MVKQNTHNDGHNALKIATWDSADGTLQMLLRRVPCRIPLGPLCFRGDSPAHSCAQKQHLITKRKALTISKPHAKLELKLNIGRMSQIILLSRPNDFL